MQKTARGNGDENMNNNNPIKTFPIFSADRYFLEELQFFTDKQRSNIFGR